MNIPKKHYKFKGYWLACLSILILGVVNAQHYPFLNYKQHSLGGSLGENIMTVVPDANGNFLMAGQAGSNNGEIRAKHGGVNNQDWWAVKIDGRTGDTIWVSRAIGGSGNDYVMDAIACSDGNYILAGTTRSDDGDVRGKHGGTGNWDLWMVKLNGATGDTLWTTQALGGSDDEGYGNFYYRSGLKACEGTDGNYLIAGRTHSPDGDVRGWHAGNCGSSICDDWWAVKVSSINGDTLWTSRALGGSRNDTFDHATATSDGNYVLSGSITSNDGDVRSLQGSFDWWAVKLNGSTGDTIWTTRGLGGSSWDSDVVVFEASDSNYVLSGQTTSSNNDVRGKHLGATINRDYWMVKINRITGDTIWTSPALGGTNHEFGSSSLASISGNLVSSLEGPDGNYILAAETYSDDGDVQGKHGATANTDWWVVQIDKNTGAVLRTSLALGGDSVGWPPAGTYPWPGYELFYQIVSTCDGGYLLSGTTRTIVINGDVSEASPVGTVASIWAVKLDKMLRKEWAKVWADGSDVRNGRVFPTVDGGYLFTSDSYAGGLRGAKTVVGQGGNCWISKVYWADTLKAEFVANTYTVCPGTPVSFTDSAKGMNIFPLSRFWYWDFGDGDTSTLQNPQHIYVNAGNYTVRQIVQKECTYDTIMHTITVLPNILINLSPSNSLCAGDSLSLDAGPGHSNYVWSTGQSTQNIYVSTAGNYSLTVGASSGCTKDTMVNVIVNPLPIVAITGDTTICPGSNTVLTASGAANYVWFPSAGLNTTTGAIVAADPLIPSSYTITATDANGCSVSTLLSLTINVLPTANAGPNDTICYGELVTLSATGGINYMWDNGTTAASISISPTLTTTYSVSVSDGKCNDDDTVTVFVNANPIADAVSDVSILPGQSTTLSGSGAGAYQWNPFAGLSCNTCQNPIASPEQTTTYYLRVTDSNGCMSLDSVTVIVDILCKGFYIPTAFSPNNDGQNDVFQIEGNCIKHVLLRIYDRWGERVFETTDLTQAWNGTYKGKPMDIGVFAYSLEATLTTNETVSKKGNVSLVR